MKIDTCFQKTKMLSELVSGDVFCLEKDPEHFYLKTKGGGNLRHNEYEAVLVGTGRWFVIVGDAPAVCYPDATITPGPPESYMCYPEGLPEGGQS